MTATKYINITVNMYSTIQLQNLMILNISNASLCLGLQLLIKLILNLGNQWSERLKYILIWSEGIPLTF